MFATSAIARQYSVKSLSRPAVTEGIYDWGERGCNSYFMVSLNVMHVQHNETSKGIYPYMCAL